jgi:hypothetical protein
MVENARTIVKFFKISPVAPCLSLPFIPYESVGRRFFVVRLKVKDGAMKFCGMIACYLPNVCEIAPGLRNMGYVCATISTS